MAYSRTFLLLGLLFAVVLILSSEVSGRELAETAETQVISVEDEKHDGYGHGHGHWHGHGKGHGHGKPGHGGAGEDVEDETEGAQN